MRETTTRFTAVESNRKIEFEAEIGPMRPKCNLTFEQTDAGTSVTFRGDSNPPGPFKLLSPLLNRKGQQVWSQRLARIKTCWSPRHPESTRQSLSRSNGWPRQTPRSTSLVGASASPRASRGGRG